MRKRSAQRPVLALTVGLLATFLAACSVVHITTPFYSTVDEPVLPTATDQKFLDKVLEATTDMNTAVNVTEEVRRVRAEMEQLSEDRYWAAEQLLQHDEIREQVLQSLVDSDNEFENPYVSAKVCGECHPKHFDEWSVSPHAYAQLSPVFNAFHGSIVLLTNGTFGDFCIRCHTPVGMNLREPSFMPNELRNITSREGITCVVCHRVAYDFGKISGRLAFIEGNIFDPVFGPSNSTILDETIASKSLQDAEDAPAGQKVHGEVITYDAITKPAFCGQCHDVTLGNTFRLEEAFSEYKSSPAAARGVTCQDCHMGTEPGVESGYDFGPAAIIAGDPTTPRRMTNHIMAGPDYSVIHPGLFPHLPPAYGNPDNQVEAPFFAELTPGRFKVVAGEFLPIPLWLEFDHDSDWGKDEFEAELEALVYEIEDMSFDLEDAELDGDEQAVADIQAEIRAKIEQFPDFKSWGGTAPESVYDIAQWFESGKRLRTQARQILEQRQYRLLSEYRKQQQAVLRAGYQVEGIDVHRFDGDGIAFTVRVKNATDGHNAPTGFIAERSVFLQVNVMDANGRTVFASGDLDPNGDVRDLHSTFVHNGSPGPAEPMFDLLEPGTYALSDEPMALDPFLFSLQSKFIVRLNRGGEREQVLAINHSPSPLPFLRPPTRSNILTGRPLGARIHRTALPPLGVRESFYAVSPEDLEGSEGPYKMNVRLVSGMVPVNLIDQIQHVGFDYGLSAREIAWQIVNGYERDVLQPTTIGHYGLAEVDGELAPVTGQLGGRSILWEYEVVFEGDPTPRQLIPAPAESKK